MQALPPSVVRVGNRPVALASEAGPSDKPEKEADGTGPGVVVPDEFWAKARSMAARSCGRMLRACCVCVCVFVRACVREREREREERERGEREGERERGEF
jgi:hypothetical protein